MKNTLWKRLWKTNWRMNEFTVKVVNVFCSTFEQFLISSSLSVYQTL